MLEPVTARARCTAPCFAQPVVRSEARATQRGCKSEGQCGGNRDASGEREHAPVEREPRCAHGLRYKRFQKSHRGHGERESATVPSPASTKLSVKNCATSLPRP